MLTDSRRQFKCRAANAERKRKRAEKKNENESEMRYSKKCNKLKKSKLPQLKCKKDMANCSAGHIENAQRERERES